MRGSRARGRGPSYKEPGTKILGPKVQAPTQSMKLGAFFLLKINLLLFNASRSRVATRRLKFQAYKILNLE